MNDRVHTQNTQGRSRSHHTKRETAQTDFEVSSSTLPSQINKGQLAGNVDASPQAVSAKSSHATLPPQPQRKEKASAVLAKEL